MSTKTDRRSRWIKSVVALLACGGLGTGERERTVSPVALDEQGGEP